MSYILCYKLLQSTSSDVSHGADDPMNSFLVTRRKRSQLLNQSFLCWGQARRRARRAARCEHIPSINVVFFQTLDVSKIRYSISQFVRFLCPSADPNEVSKVRLIEA